VYAFSGGARRLRRFTVGLASALEHSEPSAVCRLKRRERRAPVVPGRSGTLNTYPKAFGVEVTLCPLFT